MLQVMVKILITEIYLEGQKKHNTKEKESRRRLFFNETAEDEQKNFLETVESYIHYFKQNSDNLQMN